MGRAGKKGIDLHDAYLHYMERNKSSKFFKISKDKFMSVMFDLHEALMEDMMLSGSTYEMPFNLGSIQLYKHKARGNAIDYGHWRKTKEIVHLFNDHTNNYYFKFTWLRFRNSNPVIKGIHKHLSFYKFQPSRPMKRKLAQYAKNNVIINAKSI